MSTFHAGELDVQRQAGVASMAARIGGMIKGEISDNAAAFFGLQPFVFVASTDTEGQLWASVLSGWPGFMDQIDEQMMAIEASPDIVDPLQKNLMDGAHVGLLAIDFGRRQRMRLNGVVASQEKGFQVQATEVYGNCPKYIQARPIVKMVEPAGPSQTQKSNQLSPSQIAWIQQADTFIVASAHPDRGADASHRGGNPGFIRVEGNRITWPDYSGNMMFNTLGNIAANPRAGLLFIDFEQNRTLQLTGEAEIVWDSNEIAKFEGAERLVRFEVKQVVEMVDALPFKWRFETFSPFNPSLA